MLNRGTPEKPFWRYATALAAVYALLILTPWPEIGILWSAAISVISYLVAVWLAAGIQAQLTSVALMTIAAIAVHQLAAGLGMITMAIATMLAVALFQIEGDLQPGMFLAEQVCAFVWWGLLSWLAWRWFAPRASTTRQTVS